MKVDSSTGLRGSAPTRRPERGGGGKGGFATHLDEPAVAAPSGVSGAGAVTGVGAILSLQEVDDRGAGRRQAVARGETLLDRLDELRHGLLMGTLTQVQLVDLGRIVRLHRTAVDDPGLLAVLDDIDLRAQVELAKYEVASGS